MKEKDLAVLRRGMLDIGLCPSERQIEQFSMYYDILIRWNEKINLTAITEPEEVIRKHFLDSLMICGITGADIAGRAADIGTGAGFPGIPVAIMYPELDMLLVDSLGKRVTFLNECISLTGLENVKAIKARAEEIGKDPLYREQFDIVLSRAVAALPVLCEYCVPLVNTGGYFAAYKSQKAEEEIELAANAIQILGGSLETIEKRSLGENGEERTILIIRKEKSTPSAYPRKAGIPSKRPLR